MNFKFTLYSPSITCTTSPIVIGFEWASKEVASFEFLFLPASCKEIVHKLELLSNTLKESLSIFTITPTTRALKMNNININRKNKRV